MNSAVRSIVGRIMRLRGDRRGNVVVIFALLALPLIAAIGVAVDYGYAVTVRTQLQAAADAAVMAVAREVSQTRDQSKAAELGATVLQANQENWLISSDAAVHAVRFEPGSVQVTVSARVETHFLRVLGRNTLEVSVLAEAGLGGANPCIIVKSPSASQAFVVNGGVNIAAKECEIHVWSTASPAAILNGGSSINAARICLRGDRIIHNGGTYSNLERNCSPLADPYEGRISAPASTQCTQWHGNFNGPSVSLSPGVYCGWFNFNGSPSVTFQPGLYVIKDGGWNVNGGVWRGDGVTFYFADTSKIQFNSGMDIVLSAPKSGPYADILFSEKPGLSSSQFIFNSTVRENFKGVIHLPSRDVTFNASSDVQGEQFLLVANTLVLNSINWVLKPLQSGGGGSGGYISR
ncbi:pilus assembly protein TadG-related protein [Pannonibacter phragmitetus]|uniref:pilus assembly protein TadG-related protein n=1 Tax=Pannonibacter phragmitetus TaxID=121719 RepID=UPI0013DE2E85|nr:pilus assembly protein TadG-related protein [Pannonibacter phragmitetus]